jgi:maltose O-acetyltransferase
MKRLVSVPGRARRALSEETTGFSLRVLALHAAGRCSPAGTGGRLRSLFYRSLGLEIGRGTIVFGPLEFAASGFRRENIRIGAHCFINNHVYMDASGPVTIGSGVSIGHHVVIITTDHQVGSSDFRAGARRILAVTIEDGAWIAAGVTLLPGVTVGRGAVVAAGAVVSRDVPPNTLVGGVPAKMIRPLES